MVKLGFIVEGDSEKILLESNSFKGFLQELKVEFVEEIINAEGNGNLLPHNIEKHSQILKDKGASHIVILTDLDQDSCVTETKNRITPQQNHICIVSKRQIESWFLADSTALKTFIGANVQDFELPEDVKNPYEEIRQIKIQKRGRGFNNKRKLALSMLENGFSFQRAAEHPNCSSIKYFLEKLKELSQNN